MNKLQMEVAQKRISKSKEEVIKLSKIREELENEVQELTASLFEEAHKMVIYF